MTQIERLLYGAQSYNNFNTGYSHGNHGYHSRDYVDYGSETYHSRGRMDDATRNWLIGGTIAQTFAGLIAPEDPEAARTLGTLGQVATDIGIIRDYGRDQQYYHREHYNSGREREVYNNSGSYWSPSHTYDFGNFYSFVDPGRHGRHRYGGDPLLNSLNNYRPTHDPYFRGDPLLDSLNNYGHYGSSNHSSGYHHESGSYNNGWGDFGSYHNDSSYSHHSSGFDFGWNPWICY